MSKPTLTECPVCQGKGDVPSRLPFRRKACPECGGTGHVTPTRREQLIQKEKSNPRDHDR
jgi:DnaJ-class molecular chaperone